MKSLSAIEPAQDRAFDLHCIREGQGPHL